MSPYLLSHSAPCRTWSFCTSIVNHDPSVMSDAEVIIHDQNILGYVKTSGISFWITMQQHPQNKPPTICYIHILAEATLDRLAIYMPFAETYTRHAAKMSHSNYY